MDTMLQSTWRFCEVDCSRYIDGDDNRCTVSSELGALMKTTPDALKPIILGALMKRILDGLMERTQCADTTS